MTDTQSDHVQPTTAQSLRARRWKHVERAFTLAAMVVVVCLGWSTVVGMQRLFESDALTSAVKNRPVDPRSIVPLTTASLNAGGSWQMADWQWSVGVADVGAADVDGRLDRLAECPLPDELSADERHAMGRLLKALHWLPVEQNKLDGRTEYRFDSPSQKVRVLTAGDSEDEVLVSLGAAMHDRKSDTWKLLQLRSQPTRLASQSPHLLPLPAASERLCGRTDDRGQILFEVVTCPVGVAELVSAWENEEWEVTPFLAERDQGTRFLCAKEGYLVHIWSIASGQGQVQNNRDAGSSQFALMRASQN